MDRRLFILALGMFALGTDSFVVAGILPEVSRTFRVSIGAVGQLTTAYAITYALMAPVIAAVAAHVPRKRMLLFALGIFAIANLITASAPNFAVAIASRILAGIGAAMFAPTATGAAATLVAPERRGQALSIVIAGLTVSTALGTPIGAVIAALGDWRWTMAFVSALAVAAALGISLLLTNVPLPPKITLAQRIAPVADPRIALTLLCTWLYQSGHFIVYTYFTVVFDRAIGHNAVLTGALLVIWGVSGTVSNLVTGRLADSIGDRKLISGHAYRSDSGRCDILLDWRNSLDDDTRTHHLRHRFLGTSGTPATPAGRTRAPNRTCRARAEHVIHISWRHRRGHSWCARHSSIRCPSSWLSRRTGRQR